MFLFCLVFAMFCARLFICALWSPAGKGLTSWLSFVVSSVSLSLSHWYPGSGVVLDCIDSWSFQPYYFYLFSNTRLDPLENLKGKPEFNVGPLIRPLAKRHWNWPMMIHLERYLDSHHKKVVKDKLDSLCACLCRGFPIGWGLLWYFVAYVDWDLF